MPTSGGNISAEQSSETNLDPQDEAKIKELMIKLSSLVDEIEDLELVRQEKKAQIRALQKAKGMLKNVQPKISLQ